MTEPRPPRPHRHLHRVPEPGTHGQDDLDDGHDQRRPDGARDRGRLEARRVARLRLRLPRDAGAPRPARRRPRGHHARCWRATSTSTRRSRVSTRASATRSTSRSRSSGRACPIMVGGNGPNVTWRLAARLRRRAERRRAVAGRGRARRCPMIRVTLRGDRPRSRRRSPISVHIWTDDLGIAGAAAGRLLGRVPRARRQPRHGPRRGRGDVGRGARGASGRRADRGCGNGYFGERRLTMCQRAAGQPALSTVRWTGWFARNMSFGSYRCFAASRRSKVASG